MRRYSLLKSRKGVSARRSLLRVLSTWLAGWLHNLPVQGQERVPALVRQQRADVVHQMPVTRSNAARRHHQSALLVSVRNDGRLGFVAGSSLRQHNRVAVTGLRRWCRSDGISG